MGYSKSPITLDRILDRLSPLEQGRACVWTVDPGEDGRGADRWAYKVREALSIALRFPQRYPGLAAAARHYTIEIITSTTVHARPASNTPEAVMSHRPFETTPIHGLEAPSPDHAPLSVVGPQTARQIIQHWLTVQTSQPTNTPMHFPRADLSDDELQRLARWAQARTPRWYVLRVPGSGQVTLSPKTSDLPSDLIVKVNVNPEDSDATVEQRPE